MLIRCVNCEGRKEKNAIDSSLFMELGESMNRWKAICVI